MRQTLLCAAVCFCSLVAVVESRAAIVNGDFETGDLSGWTVDLNANYGVIDVPGTAKIETIDGSFRAVLTAASDVYTDFDNDSDSRSLAEISQTFTLSESATIAVDVSGSYAATPAPFSPGGEAVLQILLLDAATDNWLFFPLRIGSFHDGYDTSYSFDTLTVASVLPAGDYRLIAHAIANNNGNLNPGGSVYASLTVDNFRILAVPEPSGLALCALAMLGALPMLRLRCVRHVADSTQ